MHASDTLVGPSEVDSVGLRASRPYLIALVVFFGLMGGLGLYQAAHIRKSTASWTEAVPSVTHDTIEEALSLRDVTNPNDVDSMVKVAQHDIQRAEKKVIWGALGICALLFGFVKLMPESWNRPLDPTTAFGGLAAIVALLGLLEVAWQARTRFWTKVPCRVLHTTVLQKDNSFVPAVFFEYRLGGKKHWSWKVQITGPLTTFAKAHVLSDRYVVDSETRCYVNPAKPTEAVLAQQLNLIVAKLAGAFVLGCAFLVWLLG